MRPEQENRSHEQSTVTIDWESALARDNEEVVRRGHYVKEADSQPKIGGMGLVGRYFDDRLNRTIALKELRDEMLGNAELRQRFLVEAQITAQLEHPGIVPV